jgi:hypothetical protein
VDYGWHAPRAWFGDPTDGGTLGLGPDAALSSTMRGLVGVDFARDGLGGFYVGARGGLEAITPTDGFALDEVSVSFVAGHKWLTNGLGVQVGAGIAGAVPLFQGLQPTAVTPVAELRLGWTNRK